jgi:hypothetical protein
MFFTAVTAVLLGPVAPGFSAEQPQNRNSLRRPVPEYIQVSIQAPGMFPCRWTIVDGQTNQPVILDQYLNRNEVVQVRLRTDWVNQGTIHYHSEHEVQWTTVNFIMNGDRIKLR